MRIRPLAISLGLVLAACATPRIESTTAPPPRDEPGAFRLFVQDGASGHLRMVDGRTGSAERELPSGTAAPDWSRIYTTERRGGRTALRAVDAVSGRIVDEATYDGTYDLPVVTLSGRRGGLSPNGQWLALAANSTGNGALRSRYLIVDTAFSRTPQPVDLAGDFRFDALSDDGSRLYLEESLPGNGGRYRVRLYQVGVGLQPGAVVDKTRGAGPMTGNRLHAIPSADGQWLFSLYINGAYGPFIHALNLQQGFAWCINLPGTQKNDQARQALWALAVDRTGNTLYAVNGALGLATRIGMDRQPGIRQSATFQAPGAGVSPRSGEPAARRMSGTALLTPDGRTLFAPAERGLVAIDTSVLVARRIFLQDRTTDGLALSPDSEWLYTVSPDRGQLIRVDPATGEIAAEMAGPAAKGWLWVEGMR